LAPAFTVAIEDCASQIGSGSMPAERLPSAALVMRPAAKVSGRAIERLQDRLRALPTSVIGRIADGALWLDLRCLLVGDETAFIDNMKAL
jgi:L-seryl-tRNA(Ser) seleniumtransferase